MTYIFKAEKETIENKECECCGEPNQLAKFHIIFTDGMEHDVCNLCMVEYFTEIPEEIKSVEAI